MCSLTDADIPIGLGFHNQVAGPGMTGIPDALITQDAFEIYIETKLGDNLDHDQIRRHIDSIADLPTAGGNRYLLGITKSPAQRNEFNGLEQYGRKRKIKFAATTFQSIFEVVEKQSAEFRVDLNELIAEFRIFLQEQGLLAGSLNRMLVNPCGVTSELNMRFNLYHDQPERSKELCRYLAIYTSKEIIGVGEVRRVLIGRLRGEEFN